MSSSGRSSRFAGFYRHAIAERLAALRDSGALSRESYEALRSGTQALTAAQADRLIENVIGCFALPFAVGLNLMVNNKDFLVPMVIEEPSVVAAVSGAAKLARQAGGFSAESTPPLLIGQIQVVDLPPAAHAKERILQRKQDILDAANCLHPRMVERGGGARDVEVLIYPGRGGDMLVVHLVVDTCDAMGANIVNSMCEGVAPLVEELTGGRVFLRILSNLTDRAMVTARVRFPIELLADDGYTGTEVRDGIILANDLALVDPHRAATHNKGIMNGIDAVALATGNDWRAIEAAAHAYAARGQHYAGLTRWNSDDTGALVGTLELPLKVGIVGAPIASNPAAAVALELCGVTSARELAEVMAAVGLAQNFAAIRALSTKGIQGGHMSLHARNVAAAAGAPESIFEQVVEALITSGDIKVWKAIEIIDTITKRRSGATLAAAPDSAIGEGHGRVIMFGDHALRFGATAIASPIPLAARAHVTPRSDDLVELSIPRWNIHQRGAPGDGRSVLDAGIRTIMTRLRVDKGMTIHVDCEVPRAMGLGSSAAVTVAIVRGVASAVRLPLSDDELMSIAQECETLSHGEASDLDLALTTRPTAIAYRSGPPRETTPLRLATPIPLVIAMSGRECLTAAMIGLVKQGAAEHTERYQHMFREMDAIAREAAPLLERGELPRVGSLMNLCHGMLNALQVSTWEIEEMVDICRRRGALGAKLTGEGGGGSVVALCAGTGEPQVRVADSLRHRGYGAIVLTLPPTV